MRIQEISEGLTFDDVLLVPQKSVVVPSEVSVKTRLTKKRQPQRAPNERGHGYGYRSASGDCYSA